MTKELLLEILNKKLFFEFILNVILHLLCWHITFKLGFQILGIKIGLKKMFPAVIIMSIFSLCAKLLLPVSAFSIGMVILVAFLLMIVGNINFIKASWTSLIIVLISIAGDIIIISLLCSFDKNAANFFVKTPLGNSVGTFIETLFPALALFILPRFNISLIPSLKKKITRFDLIGLLTYAAMYYIVYCASMSLWLNLGHGSQYILSDLIFQWVATITILLGHYTLLQQTKKQRDNERQVLEGKIIQLLKENQELLELNKHFESKNLEPQEVVEAIDSIIARLKKAGNIIANPGLTELAQIGVTDREMSVAELVAQGKSNKEIAVALDLSEGRIKNIVAKLLEKLGLEDRTQLAVYVVKSNLAARE